MGKRDNRHKPGGHDLRFTVVELETQAYIIIHMKLYLVRFHEMLLFLT